MNALHDLIESIERRFAWEFLAGLAALGVVLALSVPVQLAAIVLVAAAGAAAISPSAALGACLASTPLIFHPVSIGDGNWMLLELALVAAGIGVAGRVTLEAVAQRSVAPVRELLPGAGMLIGGVVLTALALFALSNLADSGHRDASLRAVRTIIIEPLVVVPLTLRVLKRGRIDVALGALSAAMVLSASWGVIGVFGGAGVSADGVRRAIGPYDHPNNLAFFLERATLLTAIPALLVPRYRRLGLALLFVGVAAVLTTFSRGALIGLPAGLVVALWLTGRLRAIAAVGAGLVAAAGAFALLAGDRLFDRGGEGGEPSRLVIWNGAERILRDFPLTGIGPDQFYVMYGLRYIEPVGWPERYTSHPHNFLLEFWLWFGIGGLAFAVCAVAWIAWKVVSVRRVALKSMPVSIESVALPVAGAAALTAGIVHGLVDNAFFLPDLAVLTWFSIVLLAHGRAECRS